MPLARIIHECGAGSWIQLLGLRWPPNLLPKRLRAGNAGLAGRLASGLRAADTSSAAPARRAGTVSPRRRPAPADTLRMDPARRHIGTAPKPRATTTRASRNGAVRGTRSTIRLAVAATRAPGFSRPGRNPSTGASAAASPAPATAQFLHTCCGIPAPDRATSRHDAQGVATIVGWRLERMAGPGQQLTRLCCVAAPLYALLVGKAVPRT